MKAKLFETINKSSIELNKMKIGELVTKTLPNILKMELISEMEVKKMTSSDYSKIVFDMNYPVLKVVDENLSMLENRSVGKYTRYYADPYRYKDAEYLICSEWYDRNQEDYIRWLKGKVNQ